VKENIAFIFGQVPSILCFCELLTPIKIGKMTDISLEKAEIFKQLGSLLKLWLHL